MSNPTPTTDTLSRYAATSPIGMTYPRCPSAMSAARSARLATSRSWASVWGSWVPKICGSGILPLGPQLVQRPRKRDRLANVWDAANPRDRALDAQPEARVDERPVLPEIQVPAVRLLGQLVRADARQQPVVVVLALTAADDLTVPLRRQHVVVE